MIGKVIKIRWRLAVVGWFGILSLAMAILSAPVWASHQGPPLIVDGASLPDEDTDFDYHFATLQAALGTHLLDEYATISVKPGRYSGNLIINTAGVKLVSTGGALQTIIEGQVIIRARDVQLEGFSIEADSRETAVVIEAEGALISNNRIYHATHGVLVEGVNNASIKKNLIYNHTNDALIVRDSWNVEFLENELRGNGGAGALIENAHDFTFNKNLVTFNRFGGLWIRTSQRMGIAENAIHDNDIVGLSLEGASEAVILANQFLSNEVGMVLIRSIDNSVEENTFRQSRTAGLVVKSGAQGNVFKSNTIQGNQGRGATGIRLAGNVFGNEFLKNKVMENGEGLILASNDTGTPSNNLFEENEFILSDKRGIQIDPGSERNRFLKNKIYQNLQEGVANAGSATIFEKNEITQNGTVGLLLQSSENTRAEGNIISGNGAQGILAESSTGTLLAENEITSNIREGVQIMGGRNLRLLSNTMTQNGSSGLRADSAQKLSLLNNRLEENRDQGAVFQNVERLVLQQNRVRENGLGGVLLEHVTAADLEANHFTDNTRFGLLASNSAEVSALRNYWGDAQGPSGTFAGNGDAVLGLEMEEVTPWLPAQPDSLELRSVTGRILDSPDGPRIVFDATDRLGLILELFNPGWNGSADLAAMGIVLGARYNSRPEGIPPLDREVGFYSVNIDGLNTGTAEITLLYREEDQPVGLDPKNLKIFIYQDGAWLSMPGTADPKLRRVTGEIPLKYLNGSLIGLGTGGSGNLQIEGQQRQDGSKSPEKRGTPIAFAAGGQGPRPPLASAFLLMLIAFIPWLIMLLVFWLGRREAGKKHAPESEPLALRRLSHIFRFWNF